eukprot:403372896
MNSIFHNDIRSFKFRPIKQQLADKIKKISSSLMCLLIKVKEEDIMSLQNTHATSSVLQQSGKLQQLKNTNQLIKKDKISDASSVIQTSQVQYLAIIYSQYLVFFNENDKELKQPLYYLDIEFAILKTIRTSLEQESKICGINFSKNKQNIAITYVNNNNYKPQQNLYDDIKQQINEIKGQTIQLFSKKKFNIDSQLGVGLTSKVYKVFLTDKRDKPYALKVISKQNMSDDMKDSIRDEIKILKKLTNCKNVNRLYYVYESSSNLYLLLEYKDQPNLKNYTISKEFISENEIKIIMAQILLTLDYIHQKNIIHSDIKPDNILLSKISQDLNSEHIKNISNNNYDEQVDSEQVQDQLLLNQVLEITIADFGFSYDASEGKQSPKEFVSGTAGYFAPEVLKGLNQTFKSDVFSAGCILFNLISNKQLFGGQSKLQILKKNRNCILPTNLDFYVKKYSSDLEDLLRKLLTEDPKARPYSFEALQHKFFNNLRPGINHSLSINKIKQGPEQYHAVQQQFHFKSVQVIDQQLNQGTKTNNNECRMSSLSPFQLMNLNKSKASIHQRQPNINQQSYLEILKKFSNSDQALTPKSKPNQQRFLKAKLPTTPVSKPSKHQVPTFQHFNFKQNNRQDGCESFGSSNQYNKERTKYLQVDQQSQSPSRKRRRNTQKIKKSGTGALPSQFKRSQKITTEIGIEQENEENSKKKEKSIVYNQRDLFQTNLIIPHSNHKKQFSGIKQNAPKRQSSLDLLSKFNLNEDEDIMVESKIQNYIADSKPVMSQINRVHFRRSFN